MIKANYHTHSVLCDGKNTLREMVDSACDKGLHILGFSGHAPMNFLSDWAMDKDRLEKYVNEVKQIKAEYKDKIDILLGIELDADYDGFDIGDFDFTIGSVHQFRDGDKDFPIDLSAASLEKTVEEQFGGDWYKMCECYYNKLADFICECKPDIVGHIDLVTKYNQGYVYFSEEDERYRKIALRAVDKILDCKSDIIFEVNTGAMYRVGKTVPYPAPFIMEYLKKRNAKITVTSDSHSVDSLDFAFEKAFDYCRSFGFEKLTLLTSEGRICCDL